MKIYEKLFYSLLIFIISYSLLAMTFRVFKVFEIYDAHMISGTIATVLGIALFMYLLKKK